MLVSIAITTYNRTESAKNAIKNVLAQTHSPIEIIVVEDGSDSGIEAWLEKNRITQIRYVRHKKNRGLAAARNTAIQMATGEYFTFCDDDDQWPEQLAGKLVHVVRNGPADVGMSMVLAESSQPQCQVLLGEYPSLTALMKQGFTPPGSSQLYKTKLLRALGGYNENVRSGVDHDLWVSLAVIDPRVAICWGKAAMGNIDPSVSRMTSDEERRRQGIREALTIWRPKIVQAFGEDFYKHFCLSYYQYLDYKFFVQHCKKLNISGLLKQRITISLATKLVKSIYWEITGYQPCQLFPNYKGR